MKEVPPQALLDANVLFSAPLREMILAVAGAGLLLPRWSERILHETCRSLVRTGRATEPEILRLKEALTRAFPDAAVGGYEALTSAMGNHPGDRHVAAAAHHAGIPLILTRNLHDFRKLPPGLRAQSPDAFLLDLLAREPATVHAVAHEVAAVAGGREAWLKEMSKIVPRFAKAMRAAAGP